MIISRKYTAQVILLKNKNIKSLSTDSLILICFISFFYYQMFWFQFIESLQMEKNTLKIAIIVHSLLKIDEKKM